MKHVKIAFIIFLLALPFASFFIAKYVPKANATVLVASQVPWTDTGVVIAKGDELIIQAYGKWRYDSRPQYETTADGIYTGGQGALQAKIGEGKPFTVGSSYSIVSKEEGKLSLGMAECDTPSCYQNNYGNLQADIIVNEQQATTAPAEKPPETIVNETAFVPLKQPQANNTIVPEKTIEETAKACPLLSIISVIAAIVFILLPKESSSKQSK
ncbi:hypothetical protein HY992_00300 [Candidatus Micrarchaeota archaeon]|nr:hypothetical protein [Candidatus Micrarchaeota archaeon]